MLKALNDSINDSTFYGVDAVLLVKNRKIVFEEYFNGFTADILHNVASVGKSITSALVGIAIEKGFLANKNEQIASYFKQDSSIEHLSPEKEKIQIHHLLTMSAGWDCDDWDESSMGNTMHFPAWDYWGLLLLLPISVPKKSPSRMCANPSVVWQGCYY